MVDVGIFDAKTASVILIPKEIEKTRLFSESNLRNNQDNFLALTCSQT